MEEKKREKLCVVYLCVVCAQLLHIRILMQLLQQTKRTTAAVVRMNIGIYVSYDK